MTIPADAQPDVPQISRDELDDDAVILDVRNQDEWDLGHAPGAIHIPLDQLAERRGELPEVDVLPVTCRGGLPGQQRCTAYGGAVMRSDLAMAALASAAVPGMKPVTVAGAVRQAAAPSRA